MFLRGQLLHELVFYPNYLNISGLTLQTWFFLRGCCLSWNPMSASLFHPSAFLSVNLLVMEAKTESCIVMRKAAGWASLLPTVPWAKASLLDKLSGLKHGSLLFTNRDIFHLKQIFAQKRIVLVLNGLSDINGPVSDLGQRSHPQS